MLVLFLNSTIWSLMLKHNEVCENSQFLICRRFGFLLLSRVINMLGLNLPEYNASFWFISPSPYPYYLLCYISGVNFLSQTWISKSRMSLDLGVKWCLRCSSLLHCIVPLVFSVDRAGNNYLLYFTWHTQQQSQ